MRIVGVDLAAQAPKTAAVLLTLEDSRVAAELVPGPLDDDALVGLAHGVDKIGIDSPLGWPEGFVAAVTAHHRMGPWPAEADRLPLRYRLTDLWIHEQLSLWPQSVSTALLGVVALRGARLQARWASEVWGTPAPRDGSGTLVEVYPAATLKTWGLPHSGYKGPAGNHLRERILDTITTATRTWLDADRIAAACIASDHVLDALLSAVVALTAALGLTTPPPENLGHLALREGWIHIPAGGLETLADPMRIMAGPGGFGSRLAPPSTVEGGAP